VSLLLPFWLRVGVAHGGSVWLPVWLLWPVWLLVLFSFLVLTLVATLVTGSFAFGTALAATRELHHVAAALRGAGCEIQAGGRRYSFSFL
jgi:hypothetical protein